MATGFTLAAVGDIAFNGGYRDLVATQRHREVFDKVAVGLKADLVIGNLEAVLIADRPMDPPWRYCLRGAPEYAEVLAKAGFHVLSLAANHSMDYGWDALAETIARVQATGIKTVGAGKDLAEARRPAVLDIHGLRVAVLAYCSIHVEIDLYATEGKPGVAYANESWIQTDVAAAKAKNDVVLVCLHWGQEYVHYPRPRQRELARGVLAAGADLIIGHHPHVLQGIEHVGKKAIVYSLGNFMFSDEVWHGANREGQPFSAPCRLLEDSRHTAIMKANLSPQGVTELGFEPVYLGQDLAPAPGGAAKEWLPMFSRALRLSRMYPAYWFLKFVAARFRAKRFQNYSHRKISLRRLRLRHIKGILNILVHEFQQLRGAKE